LKAGLKKKASVIVAKTVALLLVCFMALGNSSEYAYAAQEETKLTLNRKNDSENAVFSVGNMLPGDTETHIYRIVVTGKSIKDIWLLIDVKDGSEKLAEVLKCKVALKDTGIVLYDGLMKDASGGLQYSLNKNESDETELVYEITAYLDTSVGNDYQGEKLKADFVWYAQENQQRIEIAALTEVPEGLKDTAFNTVEKIKKELSRVLIIKGGEGYSIDNMEFYDVRLQYWNGRAWIDVTAENFPLEGINVTLPYPKGTSPNTHDFLVSHMFTVDSERVGIKAGEVEYPPVTKSEEGLNVTFMGLSPVAVAWKALETEAQESIPSSEDTPFGEQMAEENVVITDADTGDTVPVVGYICLMVSSLAILNIIGIARKREGDGDE